MNADVSLAGRRLLSTILMVLFCVSCGSGSSPEGPIDSPEGPIEINFDFDSGLDGWVAGFADFPVGQEDNFELFSSWERLPILVQLSRTVRPTDDGGTRFWPSTRTGTTARSTTRCLSR